MVVFFLAESFANLKRNMSTDVSGLRFTVRFDDCNELKFYFKCYKKNKTCLRHDLNEK